MFIASNSAEEGGGEGREKLKGHSCKRAKIGDGAAG